VEENNHAVDYGIDFYAMQTIETPDGRRVMIGWMQNWDTVFHDDQDHWYGQMSLPREVRIKDNRLYQVPIRELLDHRRNEIKYENVLVQGNGNLAETSTSTLTKENCLRLDGISGRMIDMELSIDASEDFFEKFTICLAADEKHHTNISFRPQESIVKIDRKFSGSRRAVIHQRRAWVDTDGCKLKLRIILDRFSMEVFINDGRQVMTATLYTDMSADQIYFTCDKDAILNITKYDLVF
ncbi:MAG: GH32 C-terminal domain-containing protein, partial [Dorea sp.]|nr:GH32 C-terminal domain-containing protein [Dorea sp.]